MRRLRDKIAAASRRELLAYLALMAIALVLRLIDLGERPYHHDESQDAYFSWVLFTKHEYEYQPILHGPLRFYLTTVVYTLFGDSNVTARLAPAVMGTLIVGVPYLLRNHIGRIAAFATALMLTFGPTYLYFSRFAREDIYVACLTLALVAAMFRYLDHPSRAGPSIIGALLALLFATKESTFITCGIVGSFFVFWLAGEQIRTGSLRDAPLVKTVRTHGWVPWAYGFATFWLIFTLLFTVFLTDPDGLWAGIYEGLEYWRAQQEVGRGNEPWYFHIVLLIANEWPALLLGAVGIVASLRRPTILHAFLVWLFAFSLAAYSYASEKFAWLVMHPLLPLLVLAGIGVQVIWSARVRLVRIGGIAFVAAALAYSGYASFLVNAEHRADPKEFLVSTQSSEDVPLVAERIYGVDARVHRRTGRHVTINVDSSEGATFPWAWYFRDLPVGYIDMTTQGYVPQSQVLLMTDRARQQLLPSLTAYDGRRFRFRVWWVRDWTKKFDLGAWGDWFTERKTWNPIGGMPEWVYVRRDAEAA